MGGLQSMDGDGFDGRCQECESRDAVGPCASCEAMICGDCGVMSRDPNGRAVICTSCAGLIAGVTARAPRRASWVTVVAVAVVIAFLVAALGLLSSCSAKNHGTQGPSATVASAAGSETSANLRTDQPTDSDAASASIVAPHPHLPTRPPHKAYNLRVVEPPGGTGALTTKHTIAARLFVFADSQLHYLYGKRTFAQSPFADRMSFEVAVRPAALDDGSDLLLGAFLEDWRSRWPEATPIFLGDAADVSCEQEMRAFLNVLRNNGMSTLLSVTSNHDGFFVGNFTSKRDLDGMLAATDMPRDWTRACAEPGRLDDHRLTKGRAVAQLSAQLPPAAIWATSTAFRGATGPTDYKRSHMYYARALGGGEPGAPTVWGLFIDTVDYRDFALHRSEGAGRNGAVSRQQLAFLDRAAFEAAGLGSIGKTRFVMFGHHPTFEIERKSRKRLLEFLDARPEIIAYVAAHTHTPMERSLRLPSGRTIPQIIVGSTTDSPNAGALLEVQVSASGASAVARQRLYLDTESLCADVPALPPTTLGYTGYRIVRDGVPDLDIGTLDKLFFATGLSKLEGQRVTQIIGALLVENELVRSWAELYRSQADDQAADAGALTRITKQRYRAGNNLRALRPWLNGRRKPGRLTRYQSWWDPVGAPRVRGAQLGLYSFAANSRRFRALHNERERLGEHYFLCHAAHAAAAESARQRRAGNVVFIR